MPPILGKPRQLLISGIDANTLLTTAALAIAFGVWAPGPALAWGDEGHEVVALVTQAFLDPAVRSQVTGLLATDTDSLTAPDIASEPTWADKFRDANRNGSREKTHLWHFVDIEIGHPDLDGACFGHPPIPADTVASNGPAQDRVVDKIEEFAGELANPTTDPEERIVALKFLLHFVGDLHQPLHASDENDRGGNDKRVSAPGLGAGNLHHFWDTEFVDRLSADARSIASDLIGHISKAQQKDWSQGSAADWARESFQIARDDAYGQLPQPNAHRVYVLTDDYVSVAIQDIAIQLSKAGVRLAFMLNKALGPSHKTAKLAATAASASVRAATRSPVRPSAIGCNCPSTATVHRKRSSPGARVCRTEQRALCSGLTISSALGLRATHRGFTSVDRARSRARSSSANWRKPTT